MSNIKEVIEKYNLYSKNYTYKNNVRILNTRQGKVVIKEKKKDKNKIYNYLLSRNFNHFLLSNVDYDNYEIYPFIEEVNITSEQKALDLVIVLSILHNKTTFYKETDLDDIKRVYEDTNERIAYLFNYFNELQDMIEEKEFFSPSEYLFIRNVSKAYEALDYAGKTIKVWFEEVQNKKSSRYVLLHKNLKLDHFLVGKQNQNFISWDNAEVGFVIYDFLCFYKNEYLKFDMNKLYDVYQSKYRFTRCEELLLFTLISIPEKISIENDFNGCSKVYEWVEYLDKSHDLILKQNMKYEKEREQK